MLRALPVIAVLATAVAGCGAAPRPAPAPPRVVSIVQDDAELLFRAPARVGAALDDLRHLGVDWVRVTASWSLLEPARGDFRWTALDELHAQATRRGLRLAVDVAFFKPAWASFDADYADFAEAVARRYPDAVAFTVWNEPNLAGFLRPQWHADGRPAAPALYRRMVRAAVPRIRAAAPDAIVLIGATSSLGETSGTGDDRMAPLTFLRALTCADPGPGCAHYTPLPGDGWSHHPYAAGLAPIAHDPRPGTVRIGDLDRLATALHDLRGRFADGELPIYLTEYGDQTNPPDPTWDITPGEQARRLAEAEELARAQPRVRSVAQFLIRDLPARPGNDAATRWRDYQSGLRFLDGRPKPAHAAYALPLAVHRAGPGRVRLWGLVRPGAGRRAVRVRAGGRVVLAAETAPDGTFAETVDADPGATFLLESGGRRGAPVHGAR